MKATVLDLRYKTREILMALDRREKVTLLYHGKAKGVIVPTGAESPAKVETHAFFGMTKGETTRVETAMEGLRGSRYHAV